LTLLGVMLAGQIASMQTLPHGPGADVVKSRCMICHESDIITSQKLSLAGWTNSINKMVRWGSQITADEREVLQPYLAMHYGPKPAASHATIDGSPAASAESGAATYKRACLVCHDADIISQQKLTKAGWTNSVNKMIRWGASVTDADKQALIDHLAAQYPPR
jgi:cytochrome c5